MKIYSEKHLKYENTNSFITWHCLTSGVLDSQLFYRILHTVKFIYFLFVEVYAFVRNSTSTGLRDPVKCLGALGADTCQDEAEVADSKGNVRPSFMSFYAIIT